MIDKDPSSLRSFVEGEESSSWVFPSPHSESGSGVEPGLTVVLEVIEGHD